MNQHIVEGGCTNPRISPRGPRSRRKPTKQDLERLVARVHRFVAVTGWPWRALRRVLRKARPGA